MASTVNARIDRGAASIPRGLMAAAALGAAVFAVLGSYARWHIPTNTPITTLGFSTLLAMKSWLTTVAAVLGASQLVSAAWMWGRIPGVDYAPAWVNGGHRWLGTAAFLFTLPAAYHCLWALGYQDYSVRVMVHSILGCAFFAVFSSKMLLLRFGGLSGWVLPATGGALVAVLVLIWSTSSYWFFTH